jgi:urease accessory protein
MVEIKSRLKTRASAYRIEVKGRVQAPFAVRAAGRGEAKLESGEAVALRLPPGEVLRGGDLVTASDGRVFEVVAPMEPVLQVEADAKMLARLAYHLGNAHVPVEFGDGYLRIPDEPGAHELANVAKVTPVNAAFEGEVGSHAGHDHGHTHHDHGHHHGHDHQDHGHGHKH